MQLSDHEHSIFRYGYEEGQKFRSRHGDIHQDVFKAETDDYRIYVGYDDVEFGNFLEVTFKNRYDADGCQKKVMVSCGSARKAIIRALEFIEHHPVEEPYCDVDY
jgi:hypothetical protein